MSGRMAVFVAGILAGPWVVGPVRFALRADDTTIVHRESEEWREHLMRALRAVEGGDYGVAADALQQALVVGRDKLIRVPNSLHGTVAEFRTRLEALDEPPARGNPAVGEDVPVPGRARPWKSAPGRRFLTLDSVARALFRCLPEPAVKIYRERYEDAATRLLERARAGRNRALLERLVQHYSATEQGAEGLETLADLLLEGGHYRQAHQHYAGLAAQPVIDPGRRGRARLKLLLCLRLLGDGKPYAAARQRYLAEASGGSSWATALTDLERKVPLGAPPWRVPRDVEPGESRWGGELVAGHLPDLPGPRLALSFDSWLWSGSVDLETIERRGYLPRPFHLNQRGFIYVQKVFPFVPLVDRERIYVSGVFHLYRLDGRPGGGRLVQQIRKPSPKTLLREFTERRNSALYTTTLWRQGEERLPGLPEEVLLTHYVSDVVVPDRYMGYAVTMEVPTRSLVAFDAKTGAMLWKTSPHAEERPARRAVERPAIVWDGRRWVQVKPDSERFGPREIVADISYSSPAVVRRGRVYAAGWKQEGNIHGLVRALDLASGETVWETLVCGSSMEQTLFGELAREPFASFLVEREGLLYYLSNMGIVAALDARDGRVRWATTYDTIPIGQTLGRDPELRSLIWSHNPPLLLGHLLIVTPRDSRFLYAIDTGEGPGGESEAGRILWRYDNSVADLRDVLGYHAGALYFTGKGGVNALDISTRDERGAFPGGRDPKLRGSPLKWKRNSIPGRGALSAHGVVFADHRRLWLVDFGLREQPRPLVTESFRVTQHGKVPGRLQLAGRHLFMISDRIFSAYTAGAE